MTTLFNEAAVTLVQWETISGDDGFQQFDNINVASPIPEPGEWILLLLGCGLLALAKNRQCRPRLSSYGSSA